MELVQIVREAMPARALKEKQHPAKRSFQAIRIAVNDELASVDRMLQRSLPGAVPARPIFRYAYAGKNPRSGW